MSSDLAEHSNNEKKISLNETDKNDLAGEGEEYSQVLYDAAFYMVFDPFLMLL